MFAWKGGLCAQDLPVDQRPWPQLLASTPGLTGSPWAVWHWKVAVSLVTTLWGAMTGFREEYFQQYVVINLAVHLYFCLQLYMALDFRFISLHCGSFIDSGIENLC